MTCPCLFCRAQRLIRKWANRFVSGVVVVTLVGGGLVAGAGVVNRALNPPEREVWFAKYISLAYKADAAFDLIDEDWDEVSPKSWTEMQAQVKEIVYQIQEEGASEQLISPTSMSFRDFGPGRRTAVAAYYRQDTGEIVLNERYIYPGAFGSWLATLVHELVHAQGYFVGESSTLEAQTEITATEVLAALANLGYPGARADLLDGLRRDALKAAFYIAQFDGAPIHSTYDAPPVAGKPDARMLAAVDEANRAIFTPTELARVDHRTRWWMESSDEYIGVLARYVVKTATIEIDAACSASEIVSENFQRFWLQVITNDRGVVWTYWNKQPRLVKLHMDDLAYVLKNELDFC